MGDTFLRSETGQLIVEMNETEEYIFFFTSIFRNAYSIYNFRYIKAPMPQTPSVG